MKNKKKILYVLYGWPPNVNGGVILYVENMKRELEKKGLDVYILHNGKFNFFRKNPYIKRSKNNIYELINAFHFINIEDNPYSDKFYDKLFIKLLKEINPEIIHFHDIVGMPFSFVKIAKKYSHAKVINTFHNYYYICPRRDLMHIDNSHCNLCLEGYICDDCKIYISNFKRKLNILKFLLWTYSRNYIPNKLYRRLLSLIQKFIPAENLNFFTNSKMLNKNISINKKKSLRAIYAIKVLNQYTDLNLSVSTDVKNIFTKFGVDEKNNIVMSIGTRASEVIKPSNKKLSKKSLTFGYIGGPQSIKGLYLLIDAFNSLSSKYKNIQLMIYGVNKSSYEILNNRFVDNSNIQFMGSYSYSDLNKILKNFDIGVVPPIWHDNAPQVVFELLSAKIPIIGSNIGGIPDFVLNNINGLLFSPGSIDDLKEKIVTIITNPSLILKYRNNIKPMKTMEEHVNELIDIYNE